MKEVRRWGRLRTSQWHLVHSVRADSGGDEHILTVDGEWLPTERVQWDYLEGRRGSPQPTGAKVVEAEWPTGPVCTRCRGFLYNLERSVSID